jgi:TonB family protein
MRRLCLAGSKSFVIVALLVSQAAVLAQTAPTLSSPSSPSASLETSTRAVAQDLANGLDVLTDTQGVDFGPYLQNVQARIRQNWYSLIPSDAVMKKGKLTIELAIRKDGKLADMKLVGSSGDVSMDRAAWGGIIASKPFATLPEAFHGPSLTLRLRFYYNPGEQDARIAHAILIQSFANPPQYPKAASSAHVDGVVSLEAKVSPNGNVGEVKVLEGDSTLASVSVEAVKKWRFHPAQSNGMPIEDVVRVKVEFHLDGERVRAEVVLPGAPPSANVAP